MLSVPSYEIHDEQIVYVTNIQDDIAVLAGKVYNIKRDSFGRYIEFIKANGVVQAGDDYFFDDVIRVYDRYGTVKSINISEIPNGQAINCYIINDTVQCYDDVKNCSQYFQVINNSASGYTNYFKINDFSYSNRLSTNKDGNGWYRLQLGDREYKMINTIINDNKGNNPHNGMMRYDNGEEYFEYYKHLFKYALENDMFDERCYNDFDAYRDTISGYGFSSITNNIKDSKLYYAGKNDITNNILNTKVIRITFRLHEDLIKDGKLTDIGASELKYIDDIVMNYLTQMIPSTAILQIRYE